MPANCTTGFARKPNRNPQSKRTWNSCSAICRVQFGRTGCGGFDGDGTVLATPSFSPAPAFREGVNVFFPGTEEIQKIHAHELARLAYAQKNQIFLNTFRSG